MEGAAHDLGEGALEELCGPGEHLLGGLAGEGEEQDVFRVHPLFFHQVGQAVDQGAGLAAARAGDDQDRALGGGDGLVLGRVQFALIVDPPGGPGDMQVWLGHGK